MGKGKKAKTKQPRPSISSHGHEKHTGGQNSSAVAESSPHDVRLVFEYEKDGENQKKPVLIRLFDRPLASTTNEQVVNQDDLESSENETDESEEEDSSDEENGEESDNDESEEDSDNGDDDNREDKPSMTTSTAGETTEDDSLKLRENFMKLCTNEHVKGRFGKRLSYIGSKVDKIYKGLAVFAGADVRESIYGRSFSCDLKTTKKDIGEKKHKKPLVAMVLTNKRHIVSEFAIIRDVHQALSKGWKFVVFGEIADKDSKTAVDSILEKGAEDGTVRTPVTIIKDENEGRTTVGKRAPSEINGQNQSDHGTEEDVKRQKTDNNEENIGKEDYSNSEFFSDKSFTELPLSEPTMRAIKEMGFTKMTKIQAQSIPSLLEGTDLLGAAKTGSGKTMAFLTPVMEIISKAEFKARNGLGAVIITPTRELALQVSESCLLHVGKGACMVQRLFTVFSVIVYNF